MDNNKTPPQTDPVPYCSCYYDPVDAVRNVHCELSVEYVTQIFLKNITALVLLHPSFHRKKHSAEAGTTGPYEDQQKTQP